MLEAVRHSILPEPMREAVRFRNALINGCLICQAYRAPGVLSDEQYDAIGTGHEATVFDLREQMAIEYARRFATDHHSLDDDWWAEFKEHFSDPEILDLTFFTGRFMAFGRLTHVLGLDDACPLPGSVNAASMV